MPTHSAQPPGSGDALSKWGVWAGIGALAVAIVATWLSGIFATNGRIDALYPTILQQTKDISSIAGDLHTASDKITAAEANLTAAVTQNAELTKKIAELQEKQAAMLARQDDQVTNIQDIKKSLVDLSNNISTKFDKIQDRIDKINSTSPIKKTEFLSGSYVFASPKIMEQFAGQFKEYGVLTKTINLDESGLVQKAFEAWKETPDRDSFMWLTKDPSAANYFSKAWGQ